MESFQNFIVLLQLLIPVLLLLLGFLAGRHNEKVHYKSIHLREAEFRRIPTVSIRTLTDPRPVDQSRMVTGAVVVSVDYFKRIAAGLRVLFGGEVRSYSSLIDRGRREALLRMKAEAPDADLFLNVRVETSSISKGGQRAVGTIEVLAHGTAVYFGA